jgi:predicted DNA-binding transcriptional regulator AlpA
MNISVEDRLINALVRAIVPAVVAQVREALMGELAFHKGEDRMLTPTETANLVTLNRSSLWRMSREGRFPKPIALTNSRKGWRWSQVRKWLDDRERRPYEQRTYFGGKPYRPSKRPKPIPDPFPEAAATRKNP